MGKGTFAVFEKTGMPVILEEREIPALRPGEILVRNEYATLCRSDISTYSGKRIEKSPTILGHEITGRVAGLSEDGMTDLDGNALGIGDRVTWAIYAADPESVMSKRGIPQKSPDLFKYGHEKLIPENSFHGGLSTHTILRKHTPVMRLPEDMPVQAAAIINCAVATSAGSMRLAGDVEGRKVVLWGAGMLGVIGCAMFREHGAAEVVAVDISDERLRTALKFGATAVLKSGSFDHLAMDADVTVDYSGAVPCMDEAVEALGIGGTSVWVGGVCPQERVKVDSERIIRRLLSIKGLHNYNTDDFRHAVSFMKSAWKKYPVTDLVYDGFSLREAEKAFRYALEANPYRVGVRTGI